MDDNQNWQESMLVALITGKLTTMITFEDTKYFVTLQPYEEPTGTIEHGQCTTCGKPALRRPGDSKWYHEDPKDGNHAAHVQGWVPATPDNIVHDTAVAATVTPVQEALGLRLGQEAICSQCRKPIIYLGHYWDHVGRKPRHPAIPSDGSPYA